jgi:pimeloyl-ACP methyl ester carboxylesterase
VKARAVLAALAALLALVGAGPLAAPPAMARPTPAGAGSPAIVWAPCQRAAAAQCGTLSVPVDWHHPAGHRFDLALARRPATDPAARIGVLFFGPGGPGDSGVDRVERGIGRFSEELRRRFDIVSFDPRGVGRSHPVRCSAGLVAAQPSPLATSAAQFTALVAHGRRLAADCRARTGPLFDHVDTLSAVRDLEAVRVALGEPRLSFHGSSYGTLLGQQYAEEYPHRVRAMVLESVVDHSLGTRDFLDTQAVTAQEVFDEFVAWCGRTPSCALSGRDVRAVWRELLRRAEAGELRDPADQRMLDAFGLSVEVQRASYDVTWPELARRLATLSATVAGPPPPGRPTTATGDGEPTVAYPFAAVFCADWELPVAGHRGYAAQLRRIATLAPDLRYPMALLGVGACLGTVGPVANPQRPLRVRHTPPILVAATRYDPASGYNWATNVARQLGDRGVLLTYQGWGHGSYTTSDCVRAAVDRYLTELVGPAAGTRCPAVPAAG